jgi:hypothetical protein
MTRRFIFVTLAVLFVASLPLQAAAKANIINFSNASKNCAWVTAYRQTLTGGWDQVGANREYITDLQSDFLELRGSSQANFQIVRFHFREELDICAQR